MSVLNSALLPACSCSKQSFHWLGLLPWAPPWGEGGVLYPFFTLVWPKAFLCLSQDRPVSVGSRALTLLEKPFSAAGQVYEYPWGPWVS